MSKEAPWISVVYLPFNIREAVRMLRSDMDREAVANFLESAVSSWPTANEIAIAACYTTDSKDVGISVASAHREIVSRILAEEGDDTVRTQDQ